MARGWEGEEVHGTEGKSTENALMFKEEGWGGGGGGGGGVEREMKVTPRLLGTGPLKRPA